MVRIYTVIACSFCSQPFEKYRSPAVHCSEVCRFKDIFRSIIHNVRGCLIWPKSRNVQTGYGQFCSWDGKKRKMLTAHRLAYQHFVGHIPDGLWVLHRCDNNSCCNPEHLFLGTQTDNMQDMLAKGRGGNRSEAMRKSWITRKKNQSFLATSSGSKA